MHIRPAIPNDAEAIAQIQSDSAEAAQWAAQGFSISIAVIDGEVAGFLVWRETVPAEAEILNLAVALKFRRRGVALALASRLAQPVVYLEVRESNTAARALYRKAGYAEVGIRTAYYETPPESAIVMRLKR